LARDVRPSARSDPARGVPDRRNARPKCSLLLLSLGFRLVGSLCDNRLWLWLWQFRPDGDAMEDDREDAKGRHQQPGGFREPLPEGVARRDGRVRGQAAIEFWFRHIVQRVDVLRGAQCMWGYD